MAVPAVFLNVLGTWQDPAHSYLSAAGTVPAGVHAGCKSSGEGLIAESNASSAVPAAADSAPSILRLAFTGQVEDQLPSAKPAL